MIKESDLIGRKIKGFKFNSTKTVYYCPPMDKYLGVEGVILRKSYRGDYIIKFEYNDLWIYPASEIEKHLID